MDLYIIILYQLSSNPWVAEQEPVNMKRLELKTIGNCAYSPPPLVVLTVLVGGGGAI